MGNNRREQMKNLKVLKLIEEFIEEMSLYYPLLETVVKYNSTDDDYVIYHNHKNWKNNDFISLKIVLVEKFFESKELYNISFAYSSSVPT
jgi:hypothetical protein